jgi:hypothetical protein
VIKAGKTKIREEKNKKKKKSGYAMGFIMSYPEPLKVVAISNPHIPR